MSEERQLAKMTDWASLFWNPVSGLFWNPVSGRLAGDPAVRGLVLPAALLAALELADDLRAGAHPHHPGRPAALRPARHRHAHPGQQLRPPGHPGRRAELTMARRQQAAGATSPDHPPPPPQHHKSWRRRSPRCLEGAMTDAGNTR